MEILYVFIWSGNHSTRLTSQSQAATVTQATRLPLYTLLYPRPTHLVLRHPTSSRHLSCPRMRRQELLLNCLESCVKEGHLYAKLLKGHFIGQAWGGCRGEYWSAHAFHLGRGRQGVPRGKEEVPRKRCREKEEQDRDKGGRLNYFCIKLMSINEWCISNRPIEPPRMNMLWKGQSVPKSSQEIASKIARACFRQT